MQEKPGRQSKLSVVSALKFFLKGNILFIFSSVTIYFFDIPTRIFPSLFQQVYTDNIITHKNPEWFAPLMVFYVSLFVIELAIWTSFSVIRRKSYARIIITLSTKYIWTVFRCRCHFWPNSHQANWWHAIQAYQKQSSRWTLQYLLWS